MRDYSSARLDAPFAALASVDPGALVVRSVTSPTVTSAWEWLPARAQLDAVVRSL